MNREKIIASILDKLKQDKQNLYSKLLEEKDSIEVEKEFKEIVASILDKLRQDELYQDLYKDLSMEKNPIEVEKKFRKFITTNEINDKQDRQNLFAFLKDEGLFKKHVKIEGLHNVWITLRNEFAPKFLIEN